MNNIAFVIPVHPKDYHYIYELVKKDIFSTIDLILIFTNDYDYDIFLEKDKIKKNNIIW